MACKSSNQLEKEVLERSYNLVSKTLRLPAAAPALAKMKNMVFKTILYMNKEFGVRITDKPLWEIVPNSDLLVCTFSSTVAWALLCAKQVIIVDHVGLNIKKFYDEFKIPICTSNVNVRRVASVMLNQRQDVDPDFSPLIRDLSPFDGKCRDRILSVFQ